MALRFSRFCHQLGNSLVQCTFRPFIVMYCIALAAELDTMQVHGRIICTGVLWISLDCVVLCIKKPFRRAFRFRSEPLYWASSHSSVQCHDLKHSFRAWWCNFLDSNICMWNWCRAASEIKACRGQPLTCFSKLRCASSPMLLPCDAWSEACTILTYFQLVPYPLRCFSISQGDPTRQPTYTGPLLPLWRRVAAWRRSSRR